MSRFPLELDVVEGAECDPLDAVMSEDIDELKDSSCSVLDSLFMLKKLASPQNRFSDGASLSSSFPFSGSWVILTLPRRDPRDGSLRACSPNEPLSTPSFTINFFRRRQEFGVPDGLGIGLRLEILETTLASGFDMVIRFSLLSNKSKVW
jgi:hypothetical protein